MERKSAQTKTDTVKVEGHTDKVKKNHITCTQLQFTLPENGYSQLVSICVRKVRNIPKNCETKCKHSAIAM